MEALLPTLALLACPVGMGLMMFFMARGSRSKQGDSAPGRRAFGHDGGPSHVDGGAA